VVPADRVAKAEAAEDRVLEGTGVNKALRDHRERKANRGKVAAPVQSLIINLRTHRLKFRKHWKT
jgi:hypothetical protein